MDSPPISKPFPGFSAMYLLSETGGQRHFRADLSVPIGLEFSATRGEAKLQEPVAAKWMMGKSTPTDIVWTGLAAPVIISNRAFSILEAERFVGWGTYKVQLTGKAGESIDGYHGLVVRGRCGAIDNRQSRKVDKTMPGGVFTWWRGLYFDPTTWDGSDLFMPAGNVGWIIVVNAVKRAFESANVKNVTYIALDDVERMMI